MNDGRARVVWDCTFASKSLTGTRVFATQLVNALRTSERYKIVAVAAQGKLPGAVRNWWWLERGLARTAHKQQADVLHAAAYLGPERAECPVIVNVFDTTYLEAPQDFDWKWKLYARRIPSAVRNAAAVLTLSEYSRQAVARAYSIPPERIRIVYPGVSDSYFRAKDTQENLNIRQKYGLGDYLLFVGAQEPRKNIPALVRAAALARRAFPDLTLALVGPHGNGSAELERELRAHDNGTVRDLGYVPENDLPALYAGARAFVYASKLEGFGMPPLEAMARGVPVIAAPNPPLPEVLGDAACWTADDSPAALAAGIERVLGDAHLTAELAQKGQSHARQFTWARAADATAKLYDAVLAHTGRAISP